MEAIKHTEAFDLAYRFVTETNLNIFLTGKAGTGKTTFLKYLRQNSLKKMIVAAPTGVAAINAGGVTLHSLFQLPFTPFIPSKEANAETVNAHSLLGKLHYQKHKLDLLRNLELLVIDESSMVASHTIDAIDTILRSIKRRRNLPFGGTQVLFIGDLYQLQPVVKNPDWEILKNYYSSIFFFDSIVLKENAPVMIELKEIFRQQDSSFIDMLNGIRNNNIKEEHIYLLNSRLKRGFPSGNTEEYITLTTHNYQADEINKRKLSSLSGRSHKYKANIQGDFPEHLHPAEPEIELKEGAQVMFLKNDTEGKKYFNGKIGVVAELDDETIKVRCRGEQSDIIVTKQEWKNINYSIDSNTLEIKENETGNFTQYPLRLAWAITIHKSQGLTFDKLIIDAENAFANGQVYVALSRCTALEGLVLTSPINRNFLGAHQNLKDWEGKNKDEKNLPQKFYESRQQYILLELQNVFTWAEWLYGLRDLQRVLNEQKGNFPEECHLWIRELLEKYKSLEEVAVKFKERIITLNSHSIPIEENEALQKRIKDAAAYFSVEITQWQEKFRRHPIRVKTKKLARQADPVLEEINSAVHDILQKINICKTGFLLNDFLKNNKTISEKPLPVPSSYSGNKISYISESISPVYSELYGRITKLRKSIALKKFTSESKVFSNKQIEKICENLPSDKDSLLKIKGINRAKVSNYSTEIIQVVKDYCRENNLVPRKIEQTDTVTETLRIFNSGKTITEIAKERNFATSTIEGHLAKAIEDSLITIEQVMPMDEVQKIAAYFTPNGENIELSGIKERVPADVSWGKLRMVLTWLQKEKKPD